MPESKKLIRCFFIFLCVCMQMDIHGQCIDRDKITCGGDWSGYDYTFFCPAYCFSYDGDSSGHWGILNNKIDIRQAPPVVYTLKKKLEDSILSYAGTAFFSRLRFYSVDVVFWDSAAKFTPRVPACSAQKCKAKYYFSYEFRPDSIAQYHIGVALDSLGNVVSKFNFLPAKKYRSIDTSFTYCGLIQSARKAQPGIDPIKEIKIDYDEKKERFYWIVIQSEMNSNPTKKGMQSIHKVKIDASNLHKVSSWTNYYPVHQDRF